MRVLKKSKVLKLILTLLPLSLVVVYVACFMLDFIGLYGVAKTNSNKIKSDKSVIKIVEYEDKGKGEYKLVGLDGVVQNVSNPTITLTLGSNANISYYSKDGNAIMTPLGKDFCDNYLIHSNIWVVLMSLVPLSYVVLYATSGDKKTLPRRLAICGYGVSYILIFLCFALVYTYF